MITRKFVKYVGKVIGFTRKETKAITKQIKRGYNEGRGLKCLKCKKIYYNNSEQLKNYNSIRNNKVCVSCFEIGIGSVVTLKLDGKIKKVFVTQPDFFVDFSSVADELGECEFIRYGENLPKKVFKRLQRIYGSSLSKYEILEKFSLWGILYGKRKGFTGTVNLFGKDSELEVVDIKYSPRVMTVLEEERIRNCYDY